MVASNAFKRFPLTVGTLSAWIPANATLRILGLDPNGKDASTSFTDLTPQRLAYSVEKYSGKAIKVESKRIQTREKSSSKAYTETCYTIYTDCTLNFKQGDRVEINDTSEGKDIALLWQWEAADISGQVNITVHSGLESEI